MTLNDQEVRMRCLELGIKLGYMGSELYEVADEMFIYVWIGNKSPGKDKITFEKVSQERKE